MEMIAGFEEYEGRSDKGLRGFLDEMMLRQEREEEEDEDEGQRRDAHHAARGEGTGVSARLSHRRSRKACSRTTARRWKAPSMKSAGCSTSASPARRRRSR